MRLKAGTETETETHETETEFPSQPGRITGNDPLPSQTAPTEGKSTLLHTRPHGPAWWRALADDQGGDAFVMAFSRGKDSVACAIALIEAGYDLYPVYYVIVPGLSFVEEALDYYERHLFHGRRVTRAMSPRILPHIHDGRYLPPHLVPIAQATQDSLDFDDVDIQLMVVDHNGLPPDTMTAIALRASDNIMRRRLIALNGPVAVKKNQFYAIWDWTLPRCIETIRKAGIKLPADYQMWSRSFMVDVPDFMLKVKANYPADWKKMLEFFPLMEAIAFRAEMMRQ